MDKTSREQHEHDAAFAALAYYSDLAGHGDDHARAIMLARALVWHSLLPTFVIDDVVPGRKAWAPWKDVEDSLKAGIAQALMEHVWAGPRALCLGGPLDWELIPSDDRDPLVVPVGTAHVVYRRHTFGQLDQEKIPWQQRTMTIYLAEELLVGGPRAHGLLVEDETRDRIARLGETRPGLWTEWGDIAATPAPAVDDS
jgi:hypothetical protein